MNTSETHLHAFMGDDASCQPGSMQPSCQLHETAVPWTRHRLAQITPKDLWLSLEALLRRDHRDLDVEGLCKQFPKRLRQLKDKEGDRLKY